VSFLNTSTYIINGILIHKSLSAKNVSVNDNNISDICLISNIECWLNKAVASDKTDVINHNNNNKMELHLQITTPVNLEMHESQRWSIRQR